MRQRTAGNASVVLYLRYIAVCKTIEIPSGCDANAGWHVATETFGTPGTELDMYDATTDLEPHFVVQTFVEFS